MVDIGLYGITGVMGLYSVYGLRNVLEIINPQSVQALMKALKPYLLERQEALGDIKVSSNNELS